MTTHASSSSDPQARPDRIQPRAIPDLPDVTGMADGEASTTYSHFRSGLSKLRTGLSEHRTDLSEYRTDLSDHRTDLSMHRTGQGIQRTRMAADRTLMSVIRTSLSLIGFGFTIYQVFQKLQEAGTITHANAPRNMGIAMIVAGIVMMAGGIWRHLQFSQELRHTRSDLIEQHLIHGRSKYPISITLIVAVFLMLIGVVAIINILAG